MNRRDRFVAICAALLVAILLAPLASRAPDGLEWAAGKLGFADREAHSAARAPLPEYRVPGVDNHAFSTAIAGSAGVLGTGAVLLGVGYALRKRRPGRS